MAAGTVKWGIRDLRMHFWKDARGHEFNVRERLETPIEGRGDLYERMAEIQASYREND